MRMVRLLNEDIYKKAMHIMLDFFNISKKITKFACLYELNNNLNKTSNKSNEKKRITNRKG